MSDEAIPTISFQPHTDCPHCGHEICGSCYETIEFDAEHRRNVLTGVHGCCKCDGKYRLDYAAMRAAFDEMKASKTQ